jgi:N-acetylmuramoyl-L-alanine amidase
MSRMLRRLFFCLLTLVAGSWAVGASAAGTTAPAVRFGAPAKAETRVVVDLAAASPHSAPLDLGAGQRYAIDFPKLKVTPQSGRGSGLVTAYAWAPQGGGARLTLELSRPAQLKQAFDIPAGGSAKMHRAVFDFVAGSPRAATVAAAPQPYGDLTEVLKAVVPPTPASSREEPPLSPTAAVQPPAAAREPARIIVIDPGHGGSDPGAISGDGVAEKTVTLAAAQRLSELLQSRGRYKIVLTRANDTRLSLDQRARIAREAGADLFISLHSDAHGDASVRGGSIYTLSEDGTQRSAREAQSSGNYHSVYGENLDEHPPEVGRILYDVAQKTTVTRSARFADALLKRLKGVTPLVNNSHRVADLKVLLSPDVPAVLFELAFISNDEDAANLNSPAWRTRTMGAVADAIDDYFSANAETRQAASAPAGQ